MERGVRAPEVAGDRQGSVLELLNRLLSVPSEQTALMKREPATPPGRSPSSSPSG
jgi:hypothetical protein